VARNARLVADRLEHNMSWAELAKKHDLTEVYCRRIVREWKENQAPPVERDPMAVVDDLLRGYQADLWEFTEAADAAWQEGQFNNVIGAVRSRMEARTRVVELLQATGRLPRDLGRLRVEIDMRFVIDQIMETFAEFEVPEAAREALVTRLEYPALTAGE
jgi:hypothetical protein